MGAAEYPLGSRLSFRAADVKPEVVIVGGVVNGEPVHNDDGEVVLVPVYVSDGNGASDSTVYVWVGNIVEGPA